MSVMCLFVGHGWTYRRCRFSAGHLSRSCKRCGRVEYA